LEDGEISNDFNVKMDEDDDDEDDDDVKLLQKQIQNKQEIGEYGDEDDDDEEIDENDLKMYE
jgi:hypothetical protein